MMLAMYSPQLTRRHNSFDSPFSSTKKILRMTGFHQSLLTIPPKNLTSILRNRLPIMYANKWMAGVFIKTHMASLIRTENVKGMVVRTSLDNALPNGRFKTCQDVNYAIWLSRLLKSKVTPSSFTSASKAMKMFLRLRFSMLSCVFLPVTIPWFFVVEFFLGRFPCILVCRNYSLRLLQSLGIINGVLIFMTRCSQRIAFCIVIRNRFVYQKERYH